VTFAEHFEYTASMNAKQLLHEIATAVGEADQLVPADAAQAALAKQDPTAMRLLMAGAALQRAAWREAQQAGIRKAQAVVKKYPGRKPAAFQLTQAQQQRLYNALTEGVEDINISRLAKELRISRTTLYNYIEMGPKAAEALKHLRQSTQRGYRGNEEGKVQSARKAQRVFREGLEAAGLRRHYRPVLDEVRELRKERRARRERRAAEGWGDDSE
jgi:hypothetical protein